jgi:hypothetical protein
LWDDVWSGRSSGALGREDVVQPADCGICNRHKVESRPESDLRSNMQRISGVVLMHAHVTDAACSRACTISRVSDRASARASASDGRWRGAARPPHPPPPRSRPSSPRGPWITLAADSPGFSCARAAATGQQESTTSACGGSWMRPNARTLTRKSPGCAPARRARDARRSGWCWVIEGTGAADRRRRWNGRASTAQLAVKGSAATGVRGSAPGVRLLQASGMSNVQSTTAPVKAPI